MNEWMNSRLLRLLRQACRKAERKWKKDKLYILFQLFKDSLSAYQSAAKSAKTTYFFWINKKKHSTPKVLFSVINSAVNPSVNTVPVASDACESFLRLFIDKISNLRPKVCSLHIEPPPFSRHLKDIIAYIKPSFCPYDIIHPTFFFINCWHTCQARFGVFF